MTLEPYKGIAVQKWTKCLVIHNLVGHKNILKNYIVSPDQSQKLSVDVEGPVWRECAVTLLDIHNSTVTFSIVTFTIP